MMRVTFCPMYISSFNHIDQEYSRGAGKGARENKHQCASLLQSSACVTSANIPLAKQFTQFSPELRGRTDHPALSRKHYKVTWKRTWMQGVVKELGHSMPSYTERGLDQKAVLYNYQTDMLGAKPNHPSLKLLWFLLVNSLES